jgi:hypothetical protein
VERCSNCDEPLRIGEQMLADGKGGWRHPSKCGAELVGFKVKPPCKHLSYTMDRVTGDCHCDDCGKLLIDCLGTVLE